MTKTELELCSGSLLENNNLKNKIEGLIKTKHLPAKLDSVSLQPNKMVGESIVVELTVDIPVKKIKAKTFVVLSDYIYYENNCAYLDQYFIDPHAKNDLSMEARIMLRALRIVYNAINKISTNSPEVHGLNLNTIYVTVPSHGIPWFTDKKDY